MNRRFACPLCVVAVVVFGSCGGPVTVDDEPLEEIATARSQRIDQYLENAVDVLGVPGLTAAATDADEILYTGAFGVRSLESGAPMSAENIFHMASVSKPFVATAIVQLAEQGLIDLDAPVTLYLPYFKLADERYREITIRQMLSHTSGMPDVTDYEWDRPQVDEGAAERYVRSLGSEEMIFAPGEGTRYSNMSFDTLGDVIAKVSGMSFDDYMKSRILDPLGMMESNFLYLETDEKLRTTPHVWDREPVVSEVYPYNRRHAPSSTLNSNVIEMTSWIQANLRRGERGGTRILEAESFDLLWAPEARFDEETEVGLSWFLTEHEGARLISHGGGDTGYVSYVLFLPEENVGVVMASNYTMTPIRDLAFGVLDILRGREPDTVHPPLFLESFTVYASEGRDAAKEFLEPFVGGGAEGRALNPGELNFLGYRLMGSGHLEEAIDIFEINAALFPDIANVWDSLAEAKIEAGDKQAAIEFYRKALAIDPEFESAIRALENLGDGS